METFANLILLLFRRLWPPSTSKTAIVFSHQPSVPNFPMPHTSIFLTSYSNTSRMWVRTPLLCHKSTSLHLLLPPLDYWYTSFFFLAGPGPLHEIAVSAFSRSPLGRANNYSILLLLLTPAKSLSVPPLSPCFLELAFPLFLSFFLLLSCTPQTFLWTVSLLGFLLEVYISIRSRLRYPTLF